MVFVENFELYLTWAISHIVFLKSDYLCNCFLWVIHHCAQIYLHISISISIYHCKVLGVGTDTQYNLIFSICLLEARGLMSRQDAHSFQAELSRKPEKPREVKPATVLKKTTWYFLLQKGLGSCSISITYYSQALSVPRHFEWQPLLSWTHIPELSQQMSWENSLSITVRSVKRFFKVKPEFLQTSKGFQIQVPLLLS